ncbi:MAG: ABC transporter permease, partial [Clostridia bacterium]|nr:ABC transporter permease [Clostridia bacterium]
MNNRQKTTVIRPRSGWLDCHPSELLRYRDLIGLLVRRDFVSLYKQTILGPAWAVLQPFLTTVVFSLIFGRIAGLAPSGVPTFIFYLSGNVIWLYFSNCLTRTADTFIANRTILGKVYFPRLVLPISTAISKLIDFAIQFAFMLIFVAYYAATGAGVHPNLYVLLTPVLVLQLGLLGLACGVIISALTTRYRDLRMLMTFGTALWMYATPIAYGMDRIPERY